MVTSRETDAIRVLYVEDDPMHADLVSRALARGPPSFTVETVPSCAAAHERLRGEGVDLVLADLRLPDGSGLDLLADVHGRDPPVPLVVLTGSGDEEAAMTALRSGADDYLVKRCDSLERLPKVLAAVHARWQEHGRGRSRRLRVLYAEPTAADVDLTRRHLARHAPHIHLETVPDVGALRARLAEGEGTGETPCDVLLLDYRLPGLDALEVVKRMREELALDLPVVLVSGHGGEEVAAQALRLGIADYLIKHPGYLAALPMALDKAHRERELARALAVQRSLFDALPAHVALLGPDARIREVNERWRRFARENGLAHERAGVGSDYVALCRRAEGAWSEEAPEVAAGLAELLAGEAGELSVEYPCHAPDRERWFRLLASPVRGESPAGRPAGAVVMHVDVTERRRAEEELRWLAFHDRLTGLLSRTGFVEALRERLEGAQRRAGHVAAVDIIGMRDINEGIGQEGGDRVLCLVGERLRDALGEEGLVARIGGAEFALFDPSGASAGADATASRIAGEFARPFRLGDHTLQLEVTIGVAALGDEAPGPADLLRRAEIARFSARDGGRGRRREFDPRMEREIHERLRLTAALREAIRNAEFELHYQPKVELATGRLLSAEALLRWRHPRFGLQLPGRFIPVAERSQLIVPIGEWALHEACRRLGEWRAAGLPVVRIAVNVSLVQFLATDLAVTVEGVLERSGIEPEGLSVEITESVFDQGSDRLADQLRRLHALGIRLGMDDFGTGYSSLAYLQRYPFDEIKLDRSFVQRMTDDRYSRAIAEMVLRIGAVLGIEVVAEGVETAEQRDALVRAGCTIGQGFHFSMPLAEEDFRWLLETGDALPLPARDIACDDPGSGGRS